MPGRSRDVDHQAAGFVQDSAARRPRPLGLRVRFSGTLALLMFLLAGVFGVVIGRFSIVQLRDRIGQSLATDAARIADRLSREMAGRSRELALVGALDPLRTMRDPTEAHALLEGLRRSIADYLWIAVTDVPGHVVAASDGGLLGRDLVARIDRRDIMRNDPTNFNDDPRIMRPGEPESAMPASGYRPINLSHPIRSANGAVVGVIIAQLSWDWVRDLTRALLTPEEDGSLYRETILIAPDDVVLVGPASLLGQRVSLPAASRARAGIFGWSVEQWPNGAQYLTGVAFASGDGLAGGLGSAALQWTVLVRELPDIAFAPARHLEQAILVIGILLAVSIAVIGWVVAGFITRPLSQISLAADQLRHGHSVELPRIRGSAEVEILSESLRALVGALIANQVKLQELQVVAEHDGLTGLMNRSGLEAWLSRQEHLVQSKPAGLLVLVGDLDGFKLVNDTLGHAAGDLLLQEVAGRLHHAVRVGDAVARIGGDEFVLVLRAPLGLADGAAVETAHRVWRRVTESYAIGEDVVTIGLSMGGAVWPEDDERIGMVVHKADEALYAAKRAGKGRIAFHCPPIDR